MLNRNFWFSILALCFLLLIAFALSVSIGPVSIPLNNIVSTLLGQSISNDVWATIVMTLRLPKAFTALLAGAGLAVSGLQMQTLFRNPLADPFVLGISSGAMLGVAVMILGSGAAVSVLLPKVSFLGSINLVIASSLGALVVFFLVLLISRNLRHIISLLIVGLMVGYTVSAVVSLMIYLSLPEQVQSFYGWTLGSFGGTTWNALGGFAIATFFGIIIAFICAKPLNALLLGEQYATSMGVNLKSARFWIIVNASVLAGAVTAFCGPIGFLGIAIPHFARSIFRTNNHHILIPMSALIGAISALFFDLISSLPGLRFSIPINVITALVGAPIVLSIILRRQRGL